MRKEVILFGLLTILGMLLLSACTTNDSEGQERPSDLGVSQQNSGQKSGTGISASNNGTNSPNDLNVKSSEASDGFDNSGNIGYSNDQAYPSVSTTVSPSNPGVQQEFTLTITAEDDLGVKSLSWNSVNTFSNSESNQYFDCNNQKSCSYTWKLIPIVEGVHQLIISVEDISGKKMENIKAEAIVGPYRESTSSSSSDSSSSTSTSSSSSSSSTDSSNPSAGFFTCGNNVCEGGESYESCSEDCTLEDIVGSNPANGACEPGEDITNAPKDCTVINKQCGNNVCDDGEDRFNCYYDCKDGSSSTENGSSCSTNSDCGYKQRCRSGQCQSVECTSDYHCKGCKRCSDNQCVSCGYGAAGYCTC